jgi:polar amino acid transport system substrate-binding protein
LPTDCTARVFDGFWGLEHMGIAIPKIREAGLAYVRPFAEEAKSRGIVRRSIERSGLRGAARAQ